MVVTRSFSENGDVHVELAENKTAASITSTSEDQQDFENNNSLKMSDFFTVPKREK